MFNDWIRRTCFWIIDSLKGATIKKHLNDITFIMENSESLQARQRVTEYLKSILEYATRNVPFYSDLHSRELRNFLS